MFCSDIPLFIPDISNLCLSSVLVKIQAQNKIEYEYCTISDLLPNMTVGHWRNKSPERSVSGSEKTHSVAASTLPNCSPT